MDRGASPPKREIYREEIAKCEIYSAISPKELARFLGKRLRFVTDSRQKSRAHRDPRARSLRSIDRSTPAPETRPRTMTTGAPRKRAQTQTRKRTKKTPSEKKATDSARTGKKKSGGSDLARIDRIIQNFHADVDKFGEKVQTTLAGRVSVCKGHVQDFRSDAERTVQNVSQKTIDQLTVFGKLKAAHAKRKRKTSEDFENKERRLKKNHLASSEKRRAFLERLQEELGAIEDDTEDSLSEESDDEIAIA